MRASRRARHGGPAYALLFEQSAAAAVAEKSVCAAGARSVTVVRSLWNASSALLAGGVDLFVSSHALGHMADLCVFLREVHRVLRPGYTPRWPLLQRAGEE